ncbi:MAG: CBS domain-containing protein, partial [Candidatus Enteromonas sp.]|nr:CBS domain-containing protein [Candidatus Enteromonas sp.]
YFVSPRVKMDDLLDGFKEHHTQIAIVRKEGKVLGMVTTEDVLEELVGKIDEVELAPEAVSQ